jgi:glycogen phosphorylase
MTSVLDINTIGKPQRPRRHVRSLTGALNPLCVLSTNTQTGYFPDLDAAGKEKWPRGEETAWKNNMRGLDTGIRLIAAHTPMLIIEIDVSSITRSVVNHVQTSIARQAYNIDDLGAYQAAALTVRDNLLVCINTLYTHFDTNASRQINWNDTQTHYTRNQPKRAYYLSLEFLMGRTLDNAVLLSSHSIFMVADNMLPSAAPQPWHETEIRRERRQAGVLPRGPPCPGT